MLFSAVCLPDSALRDLVFNFYWPGLSSAISNFASDDAWNTFEEAFFRELGVKWFGAATSSGLCLTSASESLTFCDVLLFALDSSWNLLFGV